MQNRSEKNGKRQLTRQRKRKLRNGRKTDSFFSFSLSVRFVKSGNKYVVANRSNNFINSDLFLVEMRYGHTQQRALDLFGVLKLEIFQTSKRYKITKFIDNTVESD